MYQPVADLSCSVKHVTRLILSCLQSLLVLISCGEDCRREAPPLAAHVTYCKNRYKMYSILNIKRDPKEIAWEDVN
jgi:hypothetical protein